MTTLARVRAVFVILALFVLGASPAARQAPSAPADIDAWVTRAMTSFEVPGVSLAVVKDGKVVLAKGYGVRKLGDPPPVDAQTLLRHRLEHQGVHRHGARPPGRRGQARWDAPVIRLSAVVRDVRPLRDARAHRSATCWSTAAASALARATCSGGPLPPTTGRRSRGASATSSRRRASAARTPTTTCSTSWPAK